MDGVGVGGAPPEQTVRGTYVGQLADCVGFYCNVVLLQLLLDFINALRDILCLRGKQTALENHKCLKRSRKQANTRGRPPCDSAAVKHPEQAHSHTQEAGWWVSGAGEGGWGDTVL